MIDLLTVIVAHNALDELAECVDSVRRSAPGIDSEIVIVDSGSSDGTADAADALDVPCIRSSNVGYGAGNNLAWQARGPARYLLVLNPDARILGGSLSQLVLDADEHPEVGVYAPAVLDASGRRVPSLASFQTPLQALRDRITGRSIVSRYETVAGSRRFDWATGCALFFRAPCFDAVGGFDERFFLYAEEQDIFRATDREGWEHWTYPELAVLHDTEARDPNVALFVQRFRADVYLSRKWYGRTGALLTRAGLALDLLRRLVLGERDAWWDAYRAALRMLLTELTVADPRKARELQRRCVVEPGYTAPTLAGSLARRGDNASPAVPQ